MPTKREKLISAIKSGKIKDSASALEFVLQEKQKQNLIKEVIAEIQNNLPKQKDEKIEIELEIV